MPEQSQPFWYKPINRRTNIREGSRLALGALAVTGILGPGGIVYAKQRSEAMDAPPVNLFNELIKQYIDESLQRRAERAKKDSEYAKRVDPELNEDRVNILLFGYGKEHGDTYQDYGGSMSILSYDLRTGQVAIVSFSRDIRAPEVEQRLEPLVPPGKRQPVTVRKVYKAGGFTLMQEIAEKMTGLAVDYQVVLKDVVVANAIEQLAGGFLEIDIPKDHQTTTFNLGDKEYPEGFIPAGKQRLKTMEVMRYILAEDREPQGKIDERSYRKNQAMGVLMEVIKGKVGSNPAFLWQISQFLKQERTAKNIIIDFDINLFSVAISGMGGMKNIIKRLVGSFGANLKSSFPKINKEQQFVFMTLFGVTGE